MSSNLAVDPGLISFKEFFTDENGSYVDVAYYIDKTKFIKQIYQDCGKVTLFTRPRRFGKSMFLSMLKTFFEPNIKNPNDLTMHEKIFSQLDIYKDKEFCQKYMGKFPVLYITFASYSSEISYENIINNLCGAISSCAMEYSFLLQSDKLSDRDKDNLSILCDLFKSKDPLEDKITFITMSLKLLCNIIYQHYEKKIVVLIDEYDVPLSRAAQTDYYNEIKELLSNMLERLLKIDTNFSKAFITGCLRIAKESIFTGLNNFITIDNNDEEFSSLFGFTETEVKNILKNFNLEEHFEEYKTWYDGYLFGNDEIYCPWDVVCYTRDLIKKKHVQPKAYWINSSENRLAMHAFANNPSDYAEQFEKLLKGESIIVPYFNYMNYKMVMNFDNTNKNYLWTILYMIGYLTKDKDQDGVTKGCIKLRIPNKCIKECFKEQIEWSFSTENPAFKQRSNALLDCFKTDDYTLLQKKMTIAIKSYISIFDFQKGTKKEAVYHSFFNGALSTVLDNINDDYSSNDLLGYGRPDILFTLKKDNITNERKCIIIEFKVARSLNNLDVQASKAIQQIKDKYLSSVTAKFDNVTTACIYGIAFYKKECKVIFEKIDI